jgi:hypothetical protein
MPKYKIEMIVEVIGGNFRWGVLQSVRHALKDGEDILKWSVEEIEDEGESDDCS